MVAPLSSLMLTNLENKLANKNIMKSGEKQTILVLKV